MLTRPYITYGENEVLAGLWDEAVRATARPSIIPLPAVGDTVTVMERVAGFLLVGTRGGRIFGLNAYAPALVCFEARVSGSVLGFLEWDGRGYESGRKALTPGAVVTTTAGLFHLPYVDGTPQGPLPVYGDRFVGASIGSGARLIAFPEVGGQINPVVLGLSDAPDDALRLLPLKVAAPITGPAQFGDGGFVYLSREQALVFEPGKPDVGYAVQLRLEPDLFVPPAASDNAIYYVFQEGANRGVARLVPGEWSSSTLVPAKHPLLQVAAISRKALAIGTGNDLQLISSVTGQRRWSRDLEHHRDDLSHDRFPIRRIGDHLLFCSTSPTDVLAVEVVPLSEAGFKLGPREILRVDSLDIMPFVVPGGLVVARPGELHVLRPAARP